LYPSLRIRSSSAKALEDKYSVLIFIMFREFIYKTVKAIFNISFFFYIFFLITELIKPGFVSKFFYLNFILIICIVSGILSVVLKEKSVIAEKIKFSVFKIIFSVLFGGLLFIILLARSEMTQNLDFIVLMSGLFGFVLSIILFIFHSKESNL